MSGVVNVCNTERGYRGNGQVEARWQLFCAFRATALRARDDPKRFFHHFFDSLEIVPRKRDDRRPAAAVIANEIGDVHTKFVGNRGQAVEADVGACPLDRRDVLRAGADALGELLLTPPALESQLLHPFGDALPHVWNRSHPDRNYWPSLPRDASTYMSS